MCLSTRIGLPVAIGMVRPIIVLPERFANKEPDEGLEAALAHELAHVQNGDLRWLAVLRLLTLVFFSQPLFWLLRRAIQADQETLADARASTLHGDGRLAYAETLVGWARSANGVRPGALASAALALWERPSLLKRRERSARSQYARRSDSTPPLAADCELPRLDRCVGTISVHRASDRRDRTDHEGPIDGEKYTRCRPIESW